MRDPQNAEVVSHLDKKNCQACGSFLVNTENESDADP